MRVVFLLLFMCAACEIQPSPRPPPVEYEMAAVESVSYFPSSGGMSLKTYESEKYIVVLNAAHGRFRLNDQKLWSRVKVGDRVKVLRSRDRYELDMSEP